MSAPNPPSSEKETGRLEAFSDGVIAVAITLLALDLGVPHQEAGHPWHGLLQALADQWPIYLAYLLSFTTILIMWVNHHGLFKVIERVDHLFLLLNGALLLVITLFPFATILLADYIEQPDKKTAQVVYAGVSHWLWPCGTTIAVEICLARRRITLSHGGSKASAGDHQAIQIRPFALPSDVCDRFYQRRGQPCIVYWVGNLFRDTR